MRVVKPGDIVRFREWDDLVDEYGVDDYDDIECGPVDFVSQMKYLCGREFAVTEVGDGYVCGYEDDEGHHWSVTKEMLELVERGNFVFEDFYGYLKAEIESWKAERLSKDFVIICDSKEDSDVLLQGFRRFGYGTDGMPVHDGLIGYRVHIDESRVHFGNNPDETYSAESLWRHAKTMNFEDLFPQETEDFEGISDFLSGFARI